MLISRRKRMRPKLYAQYDSRELTIFGMKDNVVLRLKRSSDMEHIIAVLGICGWQWIGDTIHGRFMLEIADVVEVDYSITKLREELTKTDLLV
jgi:hypothetical protein